MMTNRQRKKIAISNSLYKRLKRKTEQELRKHGIITNDDIRQMKKDEISRLSSAPSTPERRKQIDELELSLQDKI